MSAQRRERGRPPDAEQDPADQGSRPDQSHDQATRSRPTLPGGCDVERPWPDGPSRAVDYRTHLDVDPVAAAHELAEAFGPAGARRWLQLALDELEP
jgi:hypothetical protein